MHLLALAIGVRERVRSKCRKRGGRMLKKSLVMAALLFAFGACASADTTWYLDNVTIVQLDYLGNPVYNNTVNGNFVIDTAGTSLVSWDVDVEGTNTQANYHYKSAPLNSIGVFNVANQVDFGGSGFNPYLDLYFLNPLSAGPPDPLVDAIACPGCT